MIDYGQNTHQGGKTENEDSLGARLDEENDAYCFVVADGLGGSREGGKASQIAVESIMASFDRLDRENPGSWLNDALQEANRLILERGKARGSVGSMKTTCAVVVILEGRAYWAWVGDSRIYVIRGDTLLYRSRDHSVIQILLDMGEITPKEVGGHPDRNRVLKVLGMDKELKPAIDADGLPLQPGDCILLCTDGLWEYINDKGIASLVNDKFETGAQTLIEELFEEILAGFENGTGNKQHDNLSAQLVMIR